MPLLIRNAILRVQAGCASACVHGEAIAESPKSLSGEIQIRNHPFLRILQGRRNDNGPAMYHLHGHVLFPDLDRPDPVLLPLLLELDRRLSQGLPLLGSLFQFLFADEDRCLWWA